MALKCDPFSLRSLGWGWGFAFGCMATMSSMAATATTPWIIPIRRKVLLSIWRVVWLRVQGLDKTSWLTLKLLSPDRATMP